MRRLRLREIDWPKTAQLEVAELLSDTCLSDSKADLKALLPPHTCLAVITVSCVCTWTHALGFGEGKAAMDSWQETRCSPKWLLQGLAGSRSVSVRVGESSFLCECCFADGRWVPLCQVEWLGLNDNHNKHTFWVLPMFLLCLTQVDLFTPQTIPLCRLL